MKDSQIAALEARVAALEQEAKASGSSLCAPGETTP